MTLSRTRRTPLEPLILAALTTKAQDGLAILEAIQAMTGHACSLGRLYPTLHRLERQGLVTSRWAEATAVRRGARRRVYALTPVGHRAVTAAGPGRLPARPLTPGAVLRAFVGLLVGILAPPGTAVLAVALTGVAGYVTAVLRGRSPQGHGRARGVAWLTAGLPSGIREPFRGDLYEQCEGMRRQGCSRRMMASAIGSEWLLFALHWGLSPVVSGLRPFKPPQVDQPPAKREADAHGGGGPSAS